MKTGIRVIGIDDAPFARKDKKVLVIGIVYRRNVLEGVLSTYVKKDGSDSTDKLFKMISSSRFYGQLHAVFINSITVGGFNIIDLKRLSRQLSLPVMCITRKKPNREAAEQALKRISGYRSKIKLLREVKRIYRFKYYLQIAGMGLSKAKELIKIFGIEPLRIAHIVASGVRSGESKGRV